MINRQVVKRINNGHRIPPDGTTPEVWRATGLRIGPRLLMLLVPSVTEQSAIRIVSVAVHDHNLPGCLIGKRWDLESGGVVGKERRGHVDAIQPHL